MNYQTQGWAVGIVCLFLGICIGAGIARFGDAHDPKPAPQFVGYANEPVAPAADANVSCLPGIDGFLALKPGMTRSEVFRRVGFDRNFFASIGGTQSKNAMSLSYRPPNRDGGLDEYGTIDIDFAYSHHRQSRSQDTVQEIFIIAGSGTVKNGRIIKSLCD